MHVFGSRSTDPSFPSDHASAAFGIAFGVFLVYTGFKMMFTEDKEVDPESNAIIRQFRRLVPVTAEMHGHKFFLKKEGKLYATPLFVALLFLEMTDIVFAVDSVPAIFALTREPLVVFTSNIFAILGLRSLFFLLAGFLGMFRYLSTGLATVLGFVGLKMIVEEPLEPYLEQIGIGRTAMILMSLGIVAGILTVAVIASIVAGPKEPLEHLPEEIAEGQPTEEAPNQ